MNKTSLEISNRLLQADNEKIVFSSEAVESFADFVVWQQLNTRELRNKTPMEIASLFNICALNNEFRLKVLNSMPKEEVVTDEVESYNESYEEVEPEGLLKDEIWKQLDEFEEAETLSNIPEVTLDQPKKKRAGLKK
ncbi:MAG: hypothetical protein LBN03_00415 [Bifidobacteriaceae bacterium]|jgi:hypothetical protein|nr:hypothetical protein [Bifidobacteriaceae bacterium]